MKKLYIFLKYLLANMQYFNNDTDYFIVNKNTNATTTNYELNL